MGSDFRVSSWVLGLVCFLGLCGCRAIVSCGPVRGFLAFGLLVGFWSEFRGFGGGLVFTGLCLDMLVV